MIASENVEKLKWMLWPLVLAILLFCQLAFYGSVTPLLFFAALVFGYSLRFVETGIRYPQLLIAAIILIMLYSVLKVQSIFIPAFVVLILCMLQLCRGSTNALPFFVAITALPISATVLQLLSFDLRLWSTATVARVLNAITNDVSHEGNIIYYHQHEFGVDDVCSGITMLQTGLILALMLIAVYEHRSEKTASVMQIILLMMVASVLILLSNLFRIFIIVLFSIPDDTLMHEVVGLLSMLIYFALPFSWLLRRFARRFKSYPLAERPSLFAFRGLKSMLLLLGLSLCCFSFYVAEKKRSNAMVNSIEKPGYNRKQFQYGVMQYSRPGSLVYIKPEVPFYAASHHPRICWQGSGYRFTKEKMIKINECEIVCARLLNDNGSILYAAYWFQHQQKVTGNELAWRLDAMVHGHGYQMINVTTADSSALAQEVAEWLP